MSNKAITGYAELKELAAKASPEFLELLRKQLGLKDRADNARDSYRENIPLCGKMMCIFRADFAAKRAGALGDNVKFTEHFKGLFGKAPDTRAFSCCNCYSSFVLTGKFSEEVYDNNPVDALQRASRIVSAVHDDLEHPAVAEVAALMPRLDTKKLKKLQRIQARIQEVTEGEGDKAVTKVVFISEEELDKQQANPGVVEQQPIADTLASSPSGLSAMLAAIAAVAQTTPDAGTGQILAQYPERLDIALTANVVEANGVKTRRFSAEQLMAWRNANQEPAVETEADRRASYEEAKELVAFYKAAFKDAGIKEGDWLQGTASLVGASVPAPEEAPAEHAQNGQLVPQT